MIPIIMIAVFVIPMGISGTAIALPHIAGELGSSPAMLQWVVNGFNVTFAVFSLVWGIASDRIGYRATFRLGVALVLAASAMSALAPNLLVLDAARLVAGVGCAAVATGGTSLLSNAFSGAERGRAFAVFGTVIGLGLALSPTISGGLIALFDWRGVFAAHAVLAVPALALSALLPNLRSAERRKLADFSLLRNQYFLALTLVPVAGAFGFVTLLTYLPVAFSGVAALSAGETGLLMLPMAIPVLIGPMIGARGSPMTIIRVSLAALVLGTLGMLLLAPGTWLGWLVLPMVLLGFGFGLPMGLIDAEALAAVPAHSIGTASGVLNLVRMGSEAIAVGLYAVTLTWLIGRSIPDRDLAHDTAAGHPGQAAVYANAFHWVMIAQAVLVTITIIAIERLHRARVKTAVS
ncbi:MFS transporter [Lentzea albidocapillata]|uniref:Predicted arabinose efflux permease, MFS family n=1 Tax=Lentzea albidocapillata TaxID=40571 RepID=A0A1W2FMG2_9PSEU|nr:MFS transporter [Lentzea albidocapillata]SMD23121.1 Predicted arabinose efflux permease, MFS family [Lentzea albidocapillata]